MRVKMDGEALEFSHEFDAVFTNAALHWMRNPQKVIDGVRRALKSGGAICRRVWRPWQRRIYCHRHARRSQDLRRKRRFGGDPGFIQRQTNSPTFSIRADLM